jgi:hypothetical protein
MGNGVGGNESVEALKAIAKNSSLQTDILLLLAEERKINTADVRTKLKASEAAPPNNQAGGAVE